MSLAILISDGQSFDCLGLTLVLPRRGMVPMHVELSADAVPLIGDTATLTIASEDGGSESFFGTVRRVGLWAGRARVVIAFGAGALRDTLPSRDHVGGAAPVTALLVAQGIMEASGETLAPDAEPFLSSLTLPRWTRAGADAAGEGGTAIEALDVLVSRLALLAGEPETTWRMLDDGSVWIGVDTFPIGGDTGNVFDDDGDDGAILCAPPAATLRPGTLINGRRAERVTYRIEGDALRAEVLYTVAGDVTGAELPDVYRESHACTVATQNSDGTLDLTPDDARLAGNGLRKVPFRVGIPGAKVTIPGGSRCRVAFADADPTQPFAYALDQDTAAAFALALVGDSVDVGTITATCAVAPGPVAFSYAPPFGSPQVATPTATLSGLIAGPGHRYVKGVRGP